MSQPDTAQPERVSAPCPTCNLGGGFHDAQIHAKIAIDPKYYKEKDWHRNDDRASAKNVPTACAGADGTISTTSPRLGSFLPGPWSA